MLWAGVKYIFIMNRFLVKANFGNFKVVDNTTNKMVVGYHTKKGAELTAEGLNKLKTESAIEKRIKSLKTIKGYGYYSSK
jgi:hypothetical protein